MTQFSALKQASKYIFEEITGIRSRVLSIFIENNEVVFGRFQLIYFFDMVLQMGANGASGQELQIAPKNRFRANFLKKIMDLSLLIFTLFSSPFCMKCIELTTRTYNFKDLAVGWVCVA